MTPLLLKLIFSRLPRAPMPFFVRPIARAISNRVIDTYMGPLITTHLDYLETEISKSEWFAGDAFTAADIQMSFPLEAAAAGGGLDASQPGLMNFLERIHARPANERALERGGEYRLLFD